METRKTKATSVPDDPVQRLRYQIRRLLDQVAVKKAPCRACLRDLWFVKNQRGNTMPYTDEAICHFADCPKADTFRRGRAAEDTRKDGD